MREETQEVQVEALAAQVKQPGSQGRQVLLIRSMKEPSSQPQVPSIFVTSAFAQVEQSDIVGPTQVPQMGEHGSQVRVSYL